MAPSRLGSATGASAAGPPGGRGQELTPSYHGHHSGTLSNAPKCSALYNSVMEKGPSFAWEEESLRGARALSHAPARLRTRWGALKRKKGGRFLPGGEGGALLTMQQHHLSSGHVEKVSVVGSFTWFRPRAPRALGSLRTCFKSLAVVVRTPRPRNYDEVRKHLCT